MVEGGACVDVKNMCPSQSPEVGAAHTIQYFYATSNTFACLLHLNICFCGYILTGSLGYCPLWTQSKLGEIIYESGGYTKIQQIW